ncbi:MAG: ATP-binding cassette domain-containing protein [Deltaproteobacteria bacterium]|nr:ATP-binding cassette domain-containing protein [Deltaproteobacteria bacterium]MBZ0219737.1 ATP-binding cassette domain-containing protein [Deltaproteobacteria bacterium]
MALINLRNLKLGFGNPMLLDGVDLQIERGERLCLVGRNGAGKTTLMRLLSGELKPDGGEITRAPGLKAAILSQEVPKDLQGTVFDIITGGLGDIHGLLAEYHAALSALDGGGEKAMAELERVHHELEAKGSWQAAQRVEAVVSRLRLPDKAEFSELSGGYKRRVLLGRALVAEPDILLLDEPTNHLDMESISWLEDFILGYRGTLLFVTHDRMLMQKAATRIIELDRGRLINWQCGYGEYIERKESLLYAEARENALFDKKLSEEEAWVRQGIKARRTRNEGRVRALIEMRKRRRERRELEGSARIRSQDAELSGRLVIEAKDVSFSYGNGKGPAIEGFSTVIMRGDKVGIIGPNGSGKTTLINLLLGKLKPASGTVRLGSRLEVSYFDQHRAALDGEKTVQENVGEGNDTITIYGKPRHVIGYLQDFLFSPERSRTPVKALSGGERNRLLLAKLFSKPSNLLVMDEPTNDLDIETLDLLENIIVEYAGTVLIVSHDRAFLNNTVTSTIVFENGGLNEYVGGYDDWLSQRPPAIPEKGGRKERQERPKKEKPLKLSFKEDRELKDLPGRIEALEAEQNSLYAAMADPGFYKQGGQKTAEAQTRAGEIEAELKALYSRWEELESRNDAASGRGQV